MIFIVENNQYGMGTAATRAAKSPSFYKRGDYVPGVKVDGMDVLAVRQACSFAKDFAVEHGPIILEMDTYRYHGHSMSDPGSSYRTRDEIASTRQERDPIERVKKLVLDQKLADASEFKAIERDVKKIVDDSIEECKAHPPPDVATYMAKYVYYDPHPMGKMARGTWFGKEFAYKP